MGEFCCASNGGHFVLELQVSKSTTVKIVEPITNGFSGDVWEMFRHSAPEEVLVKVGVHDDWDAYVYLKLRSYFITQDYYIYPNRNEISFLYSNKNDVLIHSC